MIRVEHVSVAFGPQQVLWDCTLSLPVGERTALMGPSGCGKTTLLQVLAGLLPPDSGRVTVNGRVSYVFQEPALFPWLTAAGNINVVLSDRQETLPRALALLEALGLSDCRDKYPHQLSGGQKQRVSIGRALAYGGDILLLDEPLKGLDPAIREQVAALILREWEGKTLLLVTHDPGEAALLGTRVLRFSNGTFA